MGEPTSSAALGRDRRGLDARGPTPASRARPRGRPRCRSRAGSRARGRSARARARQPERRSGSSTRSACSSSSWPVSSPSRTVIVSGSAMATPWTVARRGPCSGLLRLVPAMARALQLVWRARSSRRRRLPRRASPRASAARSSAASSTSSRGSSRARTGQPGRIVASRRPRRRARRAAPLCGDELGDRPRPARPPPRRAPHRRRVLRRRAPARVGQGRRPLGKTAS